MKVPMLQALTIEKPVKKDKMKSFGEVKETGINKKDDSVFADILRIYHGDLFFIDV